MDVQGAHPVLDDSFHSREADAAFVLDQLANGADPAVAQMVNVVGLVLGDVQADDFPDDFNQVVNP